jgi:hypothetical protein
MTFEANQQPARVARAIRLAASGICADERPSARIADCARMKNASVRNRRSRKKTALSWFLTVTGIYVRMYFIRT